MRFPVQSHFTAPKKSKECVQEQPPEVFCKKKVSLEILQNYWKAPMPESLFNTGWLYLKKRHWHRCFYCEFCKISKNTLLTEHLRTTSCHMSAIKLHTFQFSISFTNFFCYGHCVKRIPIQFGVFAYGAPKLFLITTTKNKTNF